MRPTILLLRPNDIEVLNKLKELFLAQSIDNSIFYSKVLNLFKDKLLFKERLNSFLFEVLFLQSITYCEDDPLDLIDITHFFYGLMEILTLNGHYDYRYLDFQIMDIMLPDLVVMEKISQEEAKNLICNN